ncbi:MAG TPA: PAS domain S-box protein, partial [Caldilineaceae bacterium]|nr:PAS domain S-box protein [Caldilineaceae bacterium]
MNELIQIERELQTLTEQAHLDNGDGSALSEQIRRVTSALTTRLRSCTSQIATLQQQLEVERSRAQEQELFTELFESTLVLVNQLDVAVVLPMILQRAAHLLKAPDGVIYLTDAQQHRMEAKIGIGEAERWVGFQVAHDSQGVIGQVWRSGQPMTVDDYATWPHRLPAVAVESEPAVLLAIPLRVGSEIMGVLGLCRRGGPTFSASEIETGQRFGHLAALALHNAHLYSAAQQELAERRRTEHTLRASEQRLRRLVEQMPAGAVYVEGDMLWLNRQAEVITGYGREELTTLDEWFGKIYPEQHQVMRERYQLGFQRQLSRTSTVEITRKDGQVRLVEFNIFVDDYTAVWLLRDVTESERLSRLLAQTERAALVGGWELTYHPTQLYWTEEMYRILEVDPSSFPLHPDMLVAMQQPEVGDVLRAAVEQLITNGQPLDRELRQRTFTGRPIWTRITANIEYGANGLPSRLYGSLQDISASKAVGEALAASEAKYRALIETTGTGFAITDADGHLLEANAEYLRLTGRATFDEILGQSPLAWTAPYDYERNVESFRQLLCGVSLRHLELDYITPAGVTNPVELNATLLDSDKGLRILALCRDIRVRREIALAQEESEARFRQLVEHLDEVFWLTTYPQKRVLYLSPAFDSVWGRPRVELGADINLRLQTIHPDDRGVVDQQIEQLGEGGYDIEYRIIRPDGEVRWIRTQAFPVHNQDGRIYRVAGIDEDITERKAAAAALSESEARFRQLAENINDGFWLVDASGVLYVSPAYERLWERPAAEFYASPGQWLTTVHPEDRERVQLA